MGHQFMDSLQLRIQYIKYKQLSEDRQGTADNFWLKEGIIIINLINLYHFGPQNFLARFMARFQSQT